MRRPKYKPLDRYRRTDPVSKWERLKVQLWRVASTALGLAIMAFAIVDARDGTAWVGWRHGPNYPVTGLAGAVATFGMFSFGFSTFVMGVWQDLPSYIAVPTVVGCGAWMLILVYMTLTY
jgi:hypothetical protein